MMEVITNVNGAVNGFIWGIPAMICIIGVGLYLSIGTGFIQMRRFVYAIRQTLGKIFDQVKGQPLFVVRESINLKENSEEK